MTTTQRPRRRQPAPEIVVERQAVMGALHSVVRMLGGMIGPHVELALYDLSTPEVALAALANGHVSNQQAGADLDYAGLRAGGAALHTLLDGQCIVTSDNRRLKSATVVFRDSAGAPYAALRVAADMSQFEMVHAWLGQLLQPLQQDGAVVADQPEMDQLMQEIISNSVHRSGKPVGMLSRQDKIAAVRVMQQRGLFIVKGGVEQAASALGVSRYTIYNYLDALRRQDGPA